MKYVATVNDQPRLVNVTGADGRYRVTLGDEVWEVDARLTAQGIYSLLIDGVSYVADVIDRDGACVVEVGGEWYEISVEEQTRHIIRTRGGAAGGPGSRTLTAPLPGKISRVAGRHQRQVRREGRRGQPVEQHHVVAVRVAAEVLERQRPHARA